MEPSITKVVNVKEKYLSFVCQEMLKFSRRVEVSESEESGFFDISYDGLKLIGDESVSLFQAIKDACCPVVSVVDDQLHNLGEIYPRFDVLPHVPGREVLKDFFSKIDIDFDPYCLRLSWVKAFSMTTALEVAKQYVLAGEKPNISFDEENGEFIVKDSVMGLRGDKGISIIQALSSKKIEPVFWVHFKIGNGMYQEPVLKTNVGVKHSSAENLVNQARKYLMERIDVL